MWYEDQQTISTIAALLIVLWLISLLFVTARLQEKHDDAWSAFGRPTLQRWYVGGFQTFAFVLTGRHAQLSDAQLSVAVWAARLLLPIMIAAVAYHEWLD